MVGPRKKSEKPAAVELAKVSPAVIDAVSPKWSQVASQWATAIGSLAVALTLFGNIYLQYQQAKVETTRALEAALNVKKVKEALQISDIKTNGKLNDIKETGETVHKLVNANMGAQLKISYLALKRVAELTQNEDDIAARDIAKKLLEEHEEKQRMVDAEKKTSMYMIVNTWFATAI